MLRRPDQPPDRRKRYRVRSGAVGPMELGGEELQFLIRLHWLHEDEASDRRAVSSPSRVWAPRKLPDVGHFQLSRRRDKLLASSICSDVGHRGGGSEILQCHWPRRARASEICFSSA